MNTPITYQGRKTHRSGSEQRRKAILDAALAIIIKDGIRAVRHRAVAREADVPLSATTYYFKDIGELIADTFTLFAERSITQYIQPFRDQAFELISGYDAQALKHPQRREMLIEELSDIVTTFILDEAKLRRGQLVAEQAFFQEAARDHRLRDLADAYQQQHMNALVVACQQFGSSNPELDAEFMLMTINAMEQRLLVHPENANKAAIFKRFKYLLDKVIPATHAS